MGGLAVLLVVVIATCWSLIRKMLPASGPSAFRKTQMVDNQMHAMSKLKELSIIVHLVRADDRDEDGVNAFWTRDVAGLFAYGPRGTSEGMPWIDIQTAMADPDGFPNDPGVSKGSEPQRYYGYWFVMVKKDVGRSPRT